MALSFRCLLKCGHGSALRTAFFPQYRCVTLCPQKAPLPPSLVENHDARNARLHRPQSPHLTIYKFQLTSMLSISHRFTGLALAGYVYGVGLTSLVASQPFPQLLEALQGTSPVLIYTAKLLIAFPFAYHYINGVRHLIWDSGRALTIKGVYSTGYLMLGLSLILTLGLLQL